MAKNNYLEKQRAVQQGFLETGERLGVQKMWDYIQITLRDPAVMGKDTFGKKRLEKIFNHLKVLAEKYHVCFTDDKEADYYQEELDAQIREGCDEFYPFYERYPELKQMKYDKARKGWRD
jgi:hypothetical protein